MAKSISKSGKLPKIGANTRAATKALLGKMKAGVTGFRKIGKKSPADIKIGGTQHNRKEAAAFIKEHRKAARQKRSPSTTNIYGWQRRGDKRNSDGSWPKEPFVAPAGTPTTGAAGYNALMKSYKGARSKQLDYYRTTRGSYSRKTGEKLDYGKAKESWMRKFLRGSSANLKKRRGDNQWRKKELEGGKSAKMHEAWRKRRATHGRTGRKTG